MSKATSYSCVEFCAGGGGQALGLEQAGFRHEAAVEIEPQFCTTLRRNRPHWNVLQQDLKSLRGEDFAGIDLIVGGVPCPPFSIAGKQLGADDERDLFPTALRLIEKAKPRAVMLENVPGFATAKFHDYRDDLMRRLARAGYQPEWRVLQAADFGVPQLRPRFILIALRAADGEFFRWPLSGAARKTVGESLLDLMAENNWPGAEKWASGADKVAPTIVGGSKLHGGPDLGPTRAKLQWAELGVDGMGIADEAPGADFPSTKAPRLTNRMVARLQSFPDEWVFTGKKTAQYRQIGNAFPPSVARAVGRSIRSAFDRSVAQVDLDDLRVDLRLLDEPTVYRARKRTKKNPQ
jgi:DNA (cytosine-5)-methyltransferase 1